ncbi:MAG: eukaryotic translation initiation factor EIF4E family protein [Bacteroidetes bacterium]|nr:eukaryotic translation initiation factor EIF4E family protein [Bacteroidota bacterium]
MADSSYSCSGLCSDDHHELSCKWTLWCHLPHDTDWSLKSYKKMHCVETLEQTISLTEMLPVKLVTNCMLFWMRDGINPIWEDARNRNGGCFSYKVVNKDVPECWKQLTYALVGNTISSDSSLISVVNGITISPKKNFCIVKIWLSNCNFQNAGMINEMVGITPHGCLFKKHTPEY